MTYFANVYVHRDTLKGHSFGQSLQTNRQASEAAVVEDETWRLAYRIVARTKEVA